jgi:hypothetical protein
MLTDPKAASGFTNGHGRAVDADVELRLAEPDVKFFPTWQMRRCRERWSRRSARRWRRS